MQANTPLKEIATEIFKLVEEGRFRRRSDIDRIAVEVNRLSSPTTRGRTMAITRLKDSGEWAVPVIVEVLRDANRQSEFAVLRRALPQLGQAAVNPLVVALQDSKDLNVKLVAAEALGKIGYRSALPYMLEILESDQSAELKAAALTALNLIDRDNRLGQQSAAEAFVQLGEEYYNHKPILETPAHQDFANIWFWNDDNGLYREAMDREAFDELMTMRCCEAALLLNRNLATAVSLWLSAFSRLEADGHAQPAYFGENHADASTFRLTAGAAYLQQVLVWALENRNRPVALMAITSMRRNSGQQALLYNLGTGQPLLEALNFPDREIRFSAALAIGGALPRADFDRSELVIPILVEALQQRGEQYALIIDSNQDRLNRLTGQLRETGKFAEIVSGEHFGSTMEAARHLPSFDLVLVAADVEQPGPAETLASMQQDYRLAFCPTMIIVDGTTLTRAKQLQEQYPFTGVAYEEQKANYLLLEADEILIRNQSREFSSLLADTYAQNAAVTLLNLALSNNQVLDLKAAEPALLEAAIHENRLEIQEAATRTLAKLDSTAAQRTIARLALDEQRDLYMRGMALQNLGISAKAFGSLLSVDDINALYRIVSSLEIDSNLRNLAAEAYGSLNLPSAQISQ
ncbi:HEAT repeat domain-containing protein, partial [Planctomycetota bacterium]